MPILSVTDTNNPAVWTPPAVWIVPATANDSELAQALSKTYKLPLREQAEDAHLSSPTQSTDAWFVLVEQHNLRLHGPDGLSIDVSFPGGSANRRSAQPGFTQQPLARAIGYHGLRRRLGRKLNILDATGGLGQDSWMMAKLGCQVTCVEQSAVLHLLLENAQQQALANAATADTAQRLTLVHADAVRWLQYGPSKTVKNTVDVIYLDPMYPQRSKSARVKKGMQLLHQLVPSGADEQRDAALFNAAIRSAVHRVVVKRPKGAAMLAGAATFTGQHTEIVSPNTRYDIYHTS